jgi:hypothetical protein
VKSHHLLSTAVAIATALLATPPAFGVGLTDQQRRLLEVEAIRAPLALSGDGAWRLHVDAHGVLHRVSETAAISSDGRLVATSRDVVDIASHRVVASLPTANTQVLRLQFVDHDARLLIATATLGDRPERAPDPSRLSVSVWDLASQTLVNDLEIDAPLHAAAALHVDFSAQTGALSFVDERRRDLVQLAPGACGAAPRTRAQVGDEIGAAFVVDPYGRWFASVQPLDAVRDAAEMATGARSALVVQDMATGRQLDRVTSKYKLIGLVATPDGATLFALASQPVEPETGEIVAGTPAVPDAERVLEVKLPDAATLATRDTAKAWERGACKEAGEVPGARAMVRAEHVLQPLWARDLGAATASATGTSEVARCVERPNGSRLFRTPDGGLWLDLDTQVATIDTKTGALAPGLPTPRTGKVCSVVTPAGNGFLNASGDTLSWRPLAAATDASKRRVVDRHPGWVASVMGPLGDRVRVIWSPGPRKASEREADAGTPSVLVADYDSSGKRLGQFEKDVSAYAGYGDEMFELDASGARPRPPAPCHDARGVPLTIGYDWRTGPFDAQRGLTCGPLPGMARLVWWSGATIAPRRDNSETTPHAEPAIDGAIAVMADDEQLHVVNLALQREFAQIDVVKVSDARVWILSARRLVLVEATGGDGHRWVRGYALP